MHKDEFPTRDDPKAKGGRAVKPIEISPEKMVERLAFLHINKKDIATIMGITVKTLNSRFGDIYNRGLVQGKRAVRNSLFQSAVEHNNTKAAMYLDNKVNADPIENAEDLSNKLEELGKQLYDVAKKGKNG